MPLHPAGKSYANIGGIIFILLSMFKPAILNLSRSTVQYIVEELKYKGSV